MFRLIAFALLGLFASRCASARAHIIPGRTFDRFISIWLGKQNYADVVNDPTIIELKKQGVLLTNYYAHSHPSQPNYFAAIAGDYFGLDHNGHVRVPIQISTVIDLLDWRGLTWKAYLEDLPGPGYLAMGSDGSTGNGAWDYVRQHNPFASFDSINLNGSRLLNMVSFNEWNQDVATGNVPQYVFLAPNMMNNGRNTSLAHATEWAREFIEPMMNGSIRNRNLVVLTYDEAGDEEGPNKVMTLLLGTSFGPNTKGTEDSTFYTHYSMLSTLEFNWQMPNLGRYDVGANIFQYVQNLGSKVLVPNKDPSNMGKVNNDASYTGPLNSKNAGKKIPYPPPNLGLMGSSGLAVLDHVVGLWNIHAKDDSPYDGNGTLYDASFPPKYVPQTPFIEEEEEQEHHHDHDLHNAREEGP
ncbi:phosphoesterase [Plectosphaerella plurivora]|uniref:Phosphoesterase n=1 Tax=Plectosphaerella plurivora TaxID=936078 RepID=A0A9P8V309_9PEZI|nr:phosphoesterase [Plectosphaerella plurivora]